MYWSREKVSTLSPAARFDWEGNEKGGTRKAWRNNQPSKTHTHKFSILFIEKKKEENTGTSNARYPRLLFRPSLKKKNRLTLYLSVYQPHRPFKKNVVILLNRAPPQQFASIEKKKRGDPYIQCCVHKRTCFGSHWIVLSTGWASACDNPSLRN